MSSSVMQRLNCDSFIRNRVSRGFTHQVIAAELQRVYPGLVGLSARSVMRYCSASTIHYSSRLNHQDVEELVAVYLIQFKSIIIQH